MLLLEEIPPSPPGLAALRYIGVDVNSMKEKMVVTRCQSISNVKVVRLEMLCVYMGGWNGVALNVDKDEVRWNCLGNIITKRVWGKVGKTSVSGWGWRRMDKKV